MGNSLGVEFRMSTKRGKKRNTRDPRDFPDPNWSPSSSDIANAAAVRPTITTADLFASTQPPAPDPIRPRTNWSVDGRSVAARSADAPHQIIYGKTRVGGTITFLSTDQGLSGNFMHVVVTIAGHRVEAIDKLYLDGQEVTFGATEGIHAGDPRWGSGEWTDLVFWSHSLGDENQVANADLVSQSDAHFPGKWTPDHRQRGCAHVYLILAFSPSRWPNGFPEISFLVRGKNDIYDPRSDTYGYTDNAALCIADYWTNTKFGIAADYDDELDEDALIDAADVSDEDVPLAAGGTEKRFTLNGSFLTSESQRQIFSKLVSSIGGEKYASTLKGKLRLLPPKWRAPTLSLGPNDLRSDVRIRTRFSKRDTFNRISGTFVSPENGYAVTDFPVVKNALYLDDDDGVENTLDVSYPMTTSGATAQRMAKIELEENRQSIVVDFVASLAAYVLQVGDVLSFTFPPMGWLNKTFRVTHLDLALDSNGGIPTVGIALVLKETAAGIYDWNEGEETAIDIAPNTFLPDPTGVQPPGNLTLESGTARLYIRSDGTVFSRIYATWTTSDVFVPVSGRHEIQYKLSGGSDWQDAAPVPGSSTSTYILDVKDGELYDVRVRAVNGLGYASAWTTENGHMVVGKTEPPTNVSTLNASVQSYGVFLSWPGIPDIDLSHYEIREGNSWEDSNFVAEISSTSLSVNFRTAGTTKFLIRSVDSSGNYSQFATAATVTIAAPSRPVGVFSIVGPTVVLDWDDSTAQFAIDRYRITYGTTFETSTLVVETRSTAYTVTAEWSALRSFYVVAIDVAGNESEPLQIDVNVIPPNAVSNLRADVFDNNALLKWDEPAAGSLPVDRYRIYRGDAFSGATFIGEVHGTFFAYFELIAGTFTYWVAAVDSAGNIGAENGISAKISEPPDFVFLDDAQLAPGDFNTLSNVFIDGNRLVGPVTTGQSWEDYFDAYSWTNFQDGADAGYPIFAQPGATDGYVQEVIDFGVLVPTSLIKLTYVADLLDLPIEIVPTIEWSPDNSTWFTASGTTVLATNFQYVRVTLAFDGDDDTSLAAVYDCRIRLDVKLVDDVGRFTASSSDADGTFVAFTVPYLDVREIVLTVESENPRIAVYNFKDIPSPTGFNAKVFDKDGVRQTAVVTYHAKGVR